MEVDVDEHGLHLIETMQGSQLLSQQEYDSLKGKSS